MSARIKGGGSSWVKFGSVRKGKDGASYIKIDEDITLKAGSTVQLQDPRKKMQLFVEKGIMTEEEAAEKIEKIPEYIRYDLVLPPPKGK